jgi:hypothetical protein
MDPQPIPAPGLSEADVRAQIVQQLNMSHLSEEEQSKIIEKLATALLRRATIALMEKMSEEQLQKMDELMQSQQVDAAREHMKSVVPNMEELIKSEIQAGLTEYKGLLAAKAGTPA